MIASTRLVSGTLLAINLIGIPLILRDSVNPRSRSSRWSARRCFGKLYHSVMHRALLRTERHRRAEAEPRANSQGG